MCEQKRRVADRPIEGRHGNVRPRASVNTLINFAY